MMQWYEYINSWGVDLNNKEHYGVGWQKHFSKIGLKSTSLFSLLVKRGQNAIWVRYHDGCSQLAISDVITGYSD